MPRVRALRSSTLCYCRNTFREDENVSESLVSRHVPFLCQSQWSSAKEIQRQTGVTYKTAWRMGHEIRKYMAETDGDHMLGGDHPFSPIVEADKAFIGGKDRQGEDDKAIVMGVQERGGPIVTRVIEDRSSWSVEPVIQDDVKVGSKIATDEAKAFYDLAKRRLLPFDRQPLREGMGARAGSYQHRRGVLGQSQAWHQWDLRLGFEAALAEVSLRVRVSSQPAEAASGRCSSGFWFLSRSRRRRGAGDHAAEEAVEAAIFVFMHRCSIRQCTSPNCPSSL